MAIHPTLIAAPKRHAMSVEELEDLDRDLAAVVKPVAKFRRREFSGGTPLREFDGDRGHLGDRGAQEEMIVRNVVELPAPRP